MENNKEIQLKTIGSPELYNRKKLCLAVSGGLISVLEATTPLWHMGWASGEGGMVSDDGSGEILQMARTPFGWGDTSGGVIITGKETASGILT